ncbi:hypothetical protein [Candidatus Tisiphia endosymbiont of Beris chalybata]
MSTKLHFVMTIVGHIIEGFLTGGNRNDIAIQHNRRAASYKKLYK